MRHGPDLVVWHCAAEQPCSPPRPPGYLHVYTINRRAHTSEQFSYFLSFVRAWSRTMANHREPIASERASVRACVRARAHARSVRRPARALSPTLCRCSIAGIGIHLGVIQHLFCCGLLRLLLQRTPKPSARVRARTRSRAARAHPCAEPAGAQQARPRAGWGARTHPSSQRRPDRPASLHLPCPGRHQRPAASRHTSAANIYERCIFECWSARGVRASRPAPRRPARGNPIV